MGTYTYIHTPIHTNIHICMYVCIETLWLLERQTQQKYAKLISGKTGREKCVEIKMENEVRDQTKENVKKY